MNKKLFLSSIIIFIMFSLSVSATDLNGSGLMSYYSFDSNFADDKASNDFTTSGNTALSGGSCVIGDCPTFDGIDDFMFTSCNGCSDFPITNDYTFSYWIKTSSNERDGLFTHGDNSIGTAGGWLDELRSGTGQTRQQWDTIGSDGIKETTGVAFNNGSWIHYVLVLDGTAVRFYRDGINFVNYTLPNTFVVPTYSLGFGGLRDNNASMFVDVTDYTGLIDEVAYYNVALTSEDILNLWNDEDGCNPVTTDCTAPANNPPIILLLSPSDDYHTNDPTPEFQYNYTDADDDNGNCSLTIDGVLSGDDLNISSGTIISVSSNNTLSEGSRSWFINCTDGTAYNSSLTRTIVIDTINPVMSWTIPANDNSSTFTDAVNSFVTDINISDDNLYFYNITLHNGSGVSIQSYEIVDLNTSSWLIQDNFTLSGLPFGTYYLNNTIGDDHSMPDWIPNKVEYIGNRLKIDDFISIMPENFDVSQMDYEVVDGKVTYYFTPVENSPVTLSYEVECDAGLKYLPDSDFKGHFICGLKYALDFENPDDFPVNVQIINDKKAIVYTKASSFNSIVSLNIVSETRSFIYSTPIVLESPFPVDDSVFFTDFVDFSVLGNFTIDANCSIYINNTLNNTANVSAAIDFNVTFLNITFDDGVYDFRFNCVDLLSDVDTSTNSFIVVHANCTDVGTTDDCSLFDNTTQRHVYSPSGCSIDFNETISCNYCSQDLQATLGDCDDDNQSMTYVDDNFISCCYVTSIASDCEIFTEPYNITTYQNCTGLIQNFTCSIPALVEFKDRMPFSCLMPDTQEYDCIVNVFEGSRLLQTNPEQTIYSTGISITSKKQETREFFTSNGGILNAYFTDKNLLTDKTFRVDTICTNGSIVHTSQTNVKPFYEGVSNIFNRIVWFKDNGVYIFFGVIFVIFAVGFLGFLWYKFKTGGQ